MRGDLIVESELGKGSTFYFYLFRRKKRKLTQLIIKLFLILHILLVEDVELNVIVAKNNSREVRASGRCGDKWSASHRTIEKNSYDLLLLDIKLPDMTGFDIAQYLRKKL